VALYGTAETSTLISNDKKKQKAEKNKNEQIFAPPTSGWKVFDGAAPAPKVRETLSSKRTSSMASMAAAAAASLRTPRAGESNNNGNNDDVLQPLQTRPKSIHLKISTAQNEKKTNNTINTITDVPDNELFVPLLFKLMCRAVFELGGHEQEGIFRKAGLKSHAELIRSEIAKGDYTILLNVSTVDALSHHKRGSSSTVSSSSGWSTQGGNSVASMNDTSWNQNGTNQHDRNLSTSSTLSSTSTSSTAHHRNRRHPKVHLRDADVAADVLKQWLRAMPEPLISFDLYACAIEAGNTKSLGKTMEVLKSLDTERCQTIMYLLNFLCNIAKTESITKMGSQQLAIVIMPNIIKSPNLNENPALAIMNANPEKEFVMMLIEHFDEIEKKVGR
jgi:hypothetical protein